MHTRLLERERVAKAKREKKALKTHAKVQASGCSVPRKGTAKARVISRTCTIVKKGLKIKPGLKIKGMKKFAAKQMED